MKRKTKLLWQKLFPLKVGDKVKIVKIIPFYRGENCRPLFKLVGKVFVIKRLGKKEENRTYGIEQVFYPGVSRHCNFRREELELVVESSDES